jgi:FMNH2-dependent dimethyl sulfone monooxygenase
VITRWSTTAAGFEAAVPFARWRGFEGASNPWGKSFEPYTWAAGLAAVTSRIAVVSTSHVLTVSPIMAAKQISTVDHISNGRAVLNTVSGWFQKELKMFGVGELDHDARYAYAEEWMEILLRLWTQSDTFDFDGRYLNARDAYQ